MKYRGISYPSFLSKGLIGWLWKRYMCPRDMHLFDECETTGTGNPDDEKKYGPFHSLTCDVCQLQVGISSIFNEYQDKQVKKKYNQLEHRTQRHYGDK